MTNVVLLGGNGYIGRNVTEKWLKKDPSAVFYVISRSGKNQLANARIHNLAADVADYQAVAAVLPDKVDYIVDFVGRPENDAIAFEQVNDKPACVMLQIAKDKHVKAMGFIGGLLGPKSFLEGKNESLTNFVPAVFGQKLLNQQLFMAMDEMTLLPSWFQFSNSLASL